MTIAERVYRIRIELMWFISPVSKETLNGSLETLQEIDDDDTSEYDTARELRYLFRFIDDSWF